jgi:hypothetical protein
MAGFGPSTGRYKDVCESSEARLRAKTSSRYPAVGALGSLAVVLGLIYSTVLFYEGQVVTGAILLVAISALIVLIVVYTVRTSRTES